MPLSEKHQKRGLKIRALNIIKFSLLLILGILFIGWVHIFAAGKDTIRIASYNILNFPGSDATSRTPYFRPIVHSMKPDILVVQEMQSQNGVNVFLNNVLNVYQNGVYSTIPFNDGPDTDNHIFFKEEAVTFVRANYIKTALRDIAEYTLVVNSSKDTLRIYSLHLKASSGADNEQKRFAEATILRNYLNNLKPNSKFLIVGDYNIYRSSEPAFQKLIGSEVDNDGQSVDPLNAIGDWTNNATFRYIHTQSPRVRSFGGGSTGGMDDRFDIMLTSAAIKNNLITSTYTSYGNDGNHFNDSINRLPNSAVADSVANALHYGSDHLPIFADFRFLSSTQTLLTTHQGWNLMAVPVITQNAPREFLFPTATSPAFAYSGDLGYVQQDTLANGFGFWIKFDSAQTLTFSGTQQLTDTIEVKQGWNIICSMKENFPVENIESIPSRNIQSKFYGFKNGYFVAQNFSIGYAYWVKLAEAGKLIFPKSK